MSYGGYNGEIPTFSMRTPTMKATSSSTGSSSHRPSALMIPSAASSNASSTDSYVSTTFRDFASHAKRCDRCCDPLETFLNKREMCPRGRHLAKLVSSSLFDEANEKYKESHRRSKSRKDDGWQHLEVDIPKGCEVVRNLLVAIDRGLQLPATAANSPQMHSPSSRSPSSNTGSHSSSHSYDRPVLGENWDYVHAPRSSRHSDEPERRSRHKNRDEEKHRRHRSQSAGAHHRRHRSDESVGLQERERRPYAAHSTRVDTSPRLSHDDVSVDSGYSTANGCPSPDMSRGSQFAEDMMRRKRRESATIPRSSLKKPVDDERLHPEYRRGHERTPSSPRIAKGGVGFNIEGQYYVPGYN